MSSEELSKDFAIKNAFNKSSTETALKNYWLGPDNKPASFLLKLGCGRTVNMIELVNTHNGKLKDRSMKEFKVSLSMTEKGPWEEVVHRKLRDSRNHTDPLPVQVFSFNGRNAKFLKFDMLSFYGKGGGLQYFASHYSGIQKLLLFCLILKF